MISLDEQERIVFQNSQYVDNSELIKRLQDSLLRDINELKLSEQDYHDSKDYIQDKVTLFRFLKEEEFNFETTHERLLDTIIWRIENDIANLTWSNSIEFYEPNGFSFFHKQDKTGRPLCFVRLRHFPAQFKDSSKSITEQVKPYACFMMEIARKLTWDKTCQNEKEGEPCVLVSQLTVIINVQKAPMIPVDRELIQTMGLVLDTRFPGFVGSVNVLNFGWMYQGIWSVLKYLLSEKAKQNIRFTVVKELEPLISPDNILEEMGGLDDYIWSIESDEMLQTYGTDLYRRRTLSEPEVPVVLPETPPSSTTSGPLSRSTSLASNSFDELFFDASDVFTSTPSSSDNNVMSPLQTPLMQSSFSSTMETSIIPSNIMHRTIATPPLLTSTASPLPGTLDHVSSSYYGNLSSWAGLRLGVQFLTSFIDNSHRRRPHNDNTILLLEQDSTELNRTPTTSSEDNDIIIVNNPVNATAPLLVVDKQQLDRSWIRHIKQISHKLVQLSFGQKHSIVYWVVLYLFLRIPLESVVRKALVRSAMVEPRRISTATIGFTAVVAAAVGASLSNAIG